MARVMTVQQTAELLQTSTKTIYRWLQDQKIPGRKIGRGWLIPEAALLEHLKGSFPQSNSTGEAD